MNKELDMNFSTNLNYVLTNLKNNITKSKFLEDKIYLEMSKNEIINCLNKIYSDIKNWGNSYDNKDYNTIIRMYNEVNSNISQLELCLANYEEEFHMDGIAYSMHEIGKILSSVKKESEKNGRR